MRSVSVVVSEADLPTLCELAFNGKIGLLRQGILEVFFDWNRKGQESEREPSFDEVLIGENRIGLKRVESLLIGEIAGGRNRRIATCERSAQDSLEDGRSVGVRRRRSAAADLEERR